MSSTCLVQLDCGSTYFSNMAHQGILFLYPTLQCALGERVLFDSSHQVLAAFREIHVGFYCG